MCFGSGTPIKTLINGTQLFVARKDGSIQVMSILDGAIIKDIKVYTPEENNNNNSVKKSLKVDRNKKIEHFIGLNAQDGIIYSATDMGRFFVINANVILIKLNNIKI